MRFSDRRKNFARSEINIGLVDIAGGKHFRKTIENRFSLIDAKTDEIARFFQIETDIGKAVVDEQESFAKIVESTTEIFAFQKFMIDTRFAGFFVFEEPVGNVVICRNHENAVIKSIAFAIAFDDVVEYVLKL
jgi:hypothetical protein